MELIIAGLLIAVGLFMRLAHESHKRYLEAESRARMLEGQLNLRKRTEQYRNEQARAFTQN